MRGEAHGKRQGVSMLEQFFMRKIQNRQRDLELEQLNTALVTDHERHTGNREGEVGDSATCLPIAFLHSRLDIPQQG
jgi:hypothetical protein